VKTVVFSHYDFDFEIQLTNKQKQNKI